MRLSKRHLDLILDTVGQHAPGSRVFLFGSRLDDTVRGGDVDLLLETKDVFSRLEQARLLSALEGRLGLPVDLLILSGDRPPSAFQRMVKARAVPLTRSSYEHLLC